MTYDNDPLESLIVEERGAKIRRAVEETYNHLESQEESESKDIALSILKGWLESGELAVLPRVHINTDDLESLWFYCVKKSCHDCITSWLLPICVLSTSELHHYAIFVLNMIEQRLRDEVEK